MSAKPHSELLDYFENALALLDEVEPDFASETPHALADLRSLIEQLEVLRESGEHLIRERDETHAENERLSEQLEIAHASQDYWRYAKAKAQQEAVIEVMAKYVDDLIDRGRAFIETRGKFPAASSGAYVMYAVARLEEMVREIAGITSSLAPSEAVTSSGDAGTQAGQPGAGGESSPASEPKP